MSESRSLREELIHEDKDYRHGYAEESLNISIATQIKVLREQREMSQGELAAKAGMKQPVISRYENVNYSSWSISSLRRLAHVFDVDLEVKFRSFGELVKSIEAFNRTALQVPKFSDDPYFSDNTKRSTEHEAVSNDGSIAIPHVASAITSTLPAISASITQATGASVSQATVIGRSTIAECFYPSSTQPPKISEAIAPESQRFVGTGLAGALVPNTYQPKKAA